MSTNRASSGGVRSLRAMFENPEAASASPEPRGRSPAASVTSNGSTSGRPTSKVRASFVSVEPSGQMAKDIGSSKKTEEGVNSTAAHRRESFSLSGAQNAELVEELKKTVSEEKEERKKSLGPAEAIPEEAILASAAPTPAPVEIREDQAMGEIVDTLGSKLKEMTLIGDEENKADNVKVEEGKETSAEKAAAEDEKPTALSEEKTSTGKAEKPTPVSQVKEATAGPSASKDAGGPVGGEAVPPPTDTVPPSEQTDAKKVENELTSTEAKPPVDVPAAVAKLAKPNGTAKPLNPTANATKPVSKPATTSSRPAAISTSKDAPAKTTNKATTVPKSPVMKPKTPTTPSATSPANSATSKPSPATKTPSEKPGKAPTASTSTTAKPKLAKPASSTTTAPHTSPFRKPRPKSPTRPVQLPSHLTAPTASSAAKHDAPASTSTLTRKPSTIGRDRTSSVKPAAPVRKQPSRPSLPAQPAPRRPDSRASLSGKAPDEGFLARMMRPTASSASKVHEKTEVKSPPRRTAPAKSKQGAPESLSTKGKRKVEEGVAKIKEKATTNGTAKETKADEKKEATPPPVAEETKEGEAAPAPEPATLPAEEKVTAPSADTEAGAAEQKGDSTPQEQDVTVSEVAETPNFEGATIR